MSADNWATCPRCLRREQIRLNSERVEAQSLYGRVDRQEYEAAIAALPSQSTPDPDDFTTFREDYEFYGAEDGVIVADYKGMCSKCGLSVELRAEKRFWEIDDV